MIMAWVYFIFYHLTTQTIAFLFRGGRFWEDLVTGECISLGFINWSNILLKIIIINVFSGQWDHMIAYAGTEHRYGVRINFRN